jgi:hypothetical protein
MRIISPVVAAIFLVTSIFGAFAAPTASPVEGLKAPSTFEFVKKTKKSAKKSKKSSKGKKGAGRCGTGKYWSKGKCASAADKKADKK